MLLQETFLSKHHLTYFPPQLLPCEPLHDLGGHLKNLFEEIPALYKEKATRTKVADMLEKSLGKKDHSTLRTSDYRRAAIGVSTSIFEVMMSTSKGILKVYMLYHSWIFVEEN